MNEIIKVKPKEKIKAIYIGIIENTILSLESTCHAFSATDKSSIYAKFNFAVCNDGKETYIIHNEEYSVKWSMKDNKYREFFDYCQIEIKDNILLVYLNSPDDRDWIWNINYKYFITSNLTGELKTEFN